MKKISYLLLISFLSFLFSNISFAEKDTTNYIATPGGGFIYSDQEIEKIREIQNERYKKEKLYFEKKQKEKQKKENIKKIDKLEKDFLAQKTHINNLLLEGTNKCKIITKKTFNSLNAKNYEINTLKENVGQKINNYSKGFYYNKDNNTCIETQNYLGNNIFKSRGECEICLNGDNTVIKVAAKLKQVKNIQKSSTLYSNKSLELIAESLLKKQNNNLEKIANLQKRAKVLINTLENGNLNIKESTKNNFLNLLKILDKKIDTELFFSNQMFKTKEIKKEIPKKIEENVDVEKDARNSIRILQLKNIKDALEAYNTRNDLPFPDNKIEIKANGRIIAYQGYIGKNVLETINFNGEGTDPKDGNYFSYYLTKDKKYYQLMAMLEEESNKSLTSSIFPKTYVEDYTSRYPFVQGKKLGILTNKDNIPVQEIPSIKTAGLDIVTTTDKYVAHIANYEKLEGTGSILAGANPMASCKRIKQVRGGVKDGTYTINPAGIPFKVYCDMTNLGTIKEKKEIPKKIEEKIDVEKDGEIDGMNLMKNLFGDDF